MSNDKERLLLLREYLRNYWKSYGTAFYLLEHSLTPKAQQLKCVDKMFISKESTSFLYLSTSRAFIRLAEKIAKLIEDKDLQEYRVNLDKEFPDHKNARDILEHFEDYAIGEGRLQKKGREITGTPVTVSVDERGYRFINVFNLTPIDMSKLAWWIDGFNFFLERKLHSIIDPGVEWKGFWPHYNYEAPEDWRTRII